MELPKQNLDSLDCVPLGESDHLRAAPLHKHPSIAGNVFEDFARALVVESELISHLFIGSARADH